MLNKTFDEIVRPGLRYAAAAVIAAVPLVAGDDVRLVSETESGVTLELVMPRLEQQDIRAADGTSCQKLRVAGWASVAIPGHPELPLRSVLIQVPSDGEAVLDVAERGHQSFADRMVSSVPRLRLSENKETIADTVADPSVYGQSNFYPGKMADISPVQWIRGVPVRRVTFYPVQWNPVTRELRVSQTMHLTVSFERGFYQATPVPAAEPSADGAFERLLADTVINYRASDSPASPVVLESDLEIDESRPSGDSLRLGVKHAGIYRVSYDDFRRAGVTVRRADPDSFRLMNRGREVAIKVVTRSGRRFAAGDYIEFYAEGLDNRFTDTNVYWLEWGGAEGARIGTSDGTMTGAGALLTSFPDMVHVEENHKQWEAMRGAVEEDRWFWDRLISPSSRIYNVQIPLPAPESYVAIVKVCYRGYTDNGHHTMVYLNGTPIGDDHWSGQIQYVQQIYPASGLLLEGSNALTIQLVKDPGASTDSVLLNWIEIEYRRRFEAVGDQLSFSAEGYGRSLVQIANLSSPDAVVFDTTDPYDVKDVTGLAGSARNTASMVSFETDLAGRRTYWAAARSIIGPPDEVERWRATSLRGRRNGADYIVIAPRGFQSAARQLCDFRKKQGLRVATVAVEDIYGEFSYGLFDPQAIKDFLTYAYLSWRKPAPTHVVLLGDANSDYKNYSAGVAKNSVPVHLSLTEVLGITPDDSWYVAVDGSDLLPDMFVGRLCAKDASSADSLVRKVIGYEKGRGSMPERALFVADNNEGIFENVNEMLIGALPSGYEARRVYLESYSSVDQATWDIISNIDAGALITNYVGHGHVTIWTGEGLFESSDVSLLHNSDLLTFVITLDCLNGYFSHPHYNSIAEEFAVATGKGAIASFAPSGSGYTWEHSLLGEEVFSSIFGKGEKGLGLITTESKIRAYGRGATDEMVRMFTLLGDPATKLAMRGKE